MPKKFQETLKEKKRLAREHAQKVHEERKRAREMKEEKWTNKNEFNLISEHRQLSREEYIHKIRTEGIAMLDHVDAIEKERREQEKMIETEIENEIQAIKDFTKQQCDYYDEILKQVSPPKEMSVEEIVKGIDKELREIYEVFVSVMDFNPKMPNPEEFLKNGKDQMFAKEIEKMKEEIEEGNLEAQKLEEEISQLKKELETENVKYAAVEQKKALETLKLEKEIKAMEAKIEFMKKDPEEVKEIEHLRKRVAEETERLEKYQAYLKKITEIIKEQRELEEKKKAKRMENVAKKMEKLNLATSSEGVEKEFK